MTGSIVLAGAIVYIPAMAYDEGLAHRISELLEGNAPVSKKMFGGISYLVGGHFVCGVVKDDLVVRVGKDDDAAARERPHTRPMDFTGRPMKGWVYVAGEGVADDDVLEGWVRWGLAYATSLPPK